MKYLMLIAVLAAAIGLVRAHNASSTAPSCCPGGCCAAQEACCDSE